MYLTCLIEILVFLKNKFQYIEDTLEYVHRLDFQYNNFIYVFFIVKK
jgi:hypothetical protein